MREASPRVALIMVMTMLACASVFAEEGAGAPESKTLSEGAKSSDAAAKDAPKKANDDADPTHFVFMMKSGERVLYVKYVDFGDVYSVKGDDGKFKSVPKDEVDKIVEPTNPPPPEPVKRLLPPPPEPEAKTADPAKKPLAKKPDPAKTDAGMGTPQGKGPAGVWTLKDGRSYNANQAIEAGDDWLIQTLDGRMVKFKKTDVAHVEK